MGMGIVGISSGFFVVNAILEGSITLAVAEGIESINPAWLRKPAADSGKLSGIFAVTAILLAAVAALFASASPDVIERLLGKAGAGEQAKNMIWSPLADYQLQYFSVDWLRKSSAGLAGLAVVYALCLVLSRVLRRYRSA